MTVSLFDLRDILVYENGIRITFKIIPDPLLLTGPYNTHLSIIPGTRHQQRLSQGNIITRQIQTKKGYYTKQKAKNNLFTVVFL